MTDERMLRALAELDVPARPDPDFADRLFATLLEELDLRPAGMAAATGPALAAVPVAVHAGTGMRGVAVARRRSTFTLLAAAALVLLGLVAAALLVGGGRPKPETPLELMQRSIQAYAQAPAVRFVVHDSNGDTRVEGDGKGTWWSWSWDLPPDGYFLYDGTRVGIYDGLTRVWKVNPVEHGGPPFPFNSEFAWTTVDYPNLVATLGHVDCPAPVAAPDMTVAGRLARGIACPSIKMTYWVDPETAMVLRTAAEEGSRYWMGPEGETSIREVTSFEAPIVPDAARFSWDGPTVTGRTGPITGTALTVGQRPPEATGTMVDGSRMTMPPARGPMAVLLSALWCEPGRAAEAALEEAARATGVPAVIVFVQDPRGTVAGYLDQHPTSLPVVTDPDGTFASAWGVTAVPSLVLLDGDGRVVDLVSGRPADTDVTATLAALAAGTPIPSPLPQPSPTPLATPPAGASPTASPRVCTDPETMVVCADPGGRLPAWSGKTADGRVISNDTLAGTPAVLWFDVLGNCMGPCPDWVRDVLKQAAAIEKAYAGRATIVLVASAETERGDTQKLLDAAGAGFDVVYDWDGSLGASLGELTNGVVVLDADGRVVEQHPGVFDPAVVRAALDRVVGPAPS